MNIRAVNAIARAMQGAYLAAFYSQTKATAWNVCIEALADVLGEHCHAFDRAAFLAQCRADALTRSDA